MIAIKPYTLHEFRTQHFVKKTIIQHQIYVHYFFLLNVYNVTIFTEYKYILLYLFTDTLGQLDKTR